MSEAEKTLKIIRTMKDTRIAPGLTPAELGAAEARFAVCFPPDLKDLLSTGLPTGPQWPDWRAAIQDTDSDAAGYLSERLDWPREGMCFDVENNAFWDPDWGERPSSLAEALEVAETAVRTAPRLIPIYSHRYLPDEPAVAGNPVLSVYQTDIIVYGRDLYHYILAESRGWTQEFAGSVDRIIRSWTRWMLQEWEP